ncbi:MAG: FliM/FliN family flagellar motor switch protein [Myxococcaceae bacterium]|nr:FliM/FliN family flagellar motor switch protein [Myxococcaceae bacterium]
MATLNTDEVNALMDAIKEGRVNEPAAPQARGNVTPYDLTSRDRIIRGQMPTLDAINEQIASMVGTGLAGRTRLNLKVSSTPATLLKLVDFNALLAPPTIVGVMSLGASSGLALAAMEPGLGETLLAAALGDRKARAEESAGEPRRELTSVERLVLKRLLTLLTDAMTRAWAPVLPFKPEVLRFESDPRLAIIGPPNEAAILSTFEVSGAMTGRIQLAIPFAAVEPVKKMLSSPPRVSSGGDTRFTRRLAEELEQIPVEMSVQLGRTTIALSKVLDLAVGEVLTLDTDEGAPVTACIEGRPKLLGQPRVLGGSHAVVLDEGLRPTEGERPHRPRPSIAAPLPDAA